MSRHVPSAAAAIGAAATLLALASVVHSGGDVWRRLDTQRTASASLTDAERRVARFEGTGASSEALDFYAAYLAPGDRVYFQGPPSADPGVQAAFASVGRLYLLPATQTQYLPEATAVASYLSDPSLLGVRFITQQRLGRHPIYLSRIGAP